MPKFSPQQRELVRLRHMVERYVLALGVPRSGKTAALIAGFLLWSLQDKYIGRRFGLLAYTLAQVESVIMPEVEIVLADLGLPPPSVNNRTKSFKINGREYVHLFGKNRNGRERMQGLSLQGVYVDEVVNIHRVVLEEAVQRLGVAGEFDQKLVMTANSGVPSHWFKKQWVERKDKLGMKIIELLPGANPMIDMSFYENLGVVGSPGAQARRLMNEWAGDGLKVFPRFHPPVPAPPRSEFVEYGLGVDIAFSSVTHAILFGRHLNGVWWALDEWRWDGERDGQIPMFDQCHRIWSWLRQNEYEIEFAIYDAAAVEFSLEFARHFKGDITPCDKDRKAAFGRLRSLLESDQVRLSDQVPEFFDELVALEFDPERAIKSEDVEVKGSDHGVDAAKDFFYTLGYGYIEWLT